MLQPLYSLNQMKSAGLVSTRDGGGGAGEAAPLVGKLRRGAACTGIRPARGSAVAIKQSVIPIKRATVSRLLRAVIHTLTWEARAHGAGGEQLARRYHDPRYRALLADVALGVAVPAVLAFTPFGQAVLGIVDPLPEALGAFLLGFLIVHISALVRLPLSIWLGLLHERAFGFSRQSSRDFAVDRLKAVAIGSVLTGTVLAGLVLCAQAFPSAWPLAAAAGGALVVLLLSFVAPVVLEPIFNKFRPVEASSLRDAVLKLGDDAAVPIREVLVADASKRTTKLNAYVSGLGATRRVVLYDTLLEQASTPEILTVVAHELGHRRYRHVALGTAIAMAGVAAVVVALWALLSSEAVLDAIGATGPADAHDRRVRAARRDAPRARWERRCTPRSPAGGSTRATASHSSRPAISRRSSRRSDACPRPTCPTRRRPGSPISGSSAIRPCPSAWQRRVCVAASVTVSA